MARNISKVLPGSCSQLIILSDSSKPLCVGQRVYELEKVIERAVILPRDTVLTLQLPEYNYPLPMTQPMSVGVRHETHLIPHLNEEDGRKHRSGFCHISLLSQALACRQ
ncbi:MULTISPECIES: hypothetical protein [Pantoea]|uniref:Uncharacterized protein n=1 Tax=Candidatus Pantoea gossypiicola TaxID=2608008 RepID=A0AB34CIC4_9GAMM|nr:MULTISPECIES: hypothetical protein [Pantoea]KAA5928924.1 hypothetical protein F3I59_11905 [Pantoea sp. VH_8]KAA5934816.1 hypothetical protein F3I58_10800 [Pantoea sp. VH_4]KAA5986071.1 hypothetical protein F3I49_10965 [Pantoea sp. M_4]KAA6124338.1 hypothetical protein F3I20_12515 [Pantoea gossypiicola]